MTTNRTCSTSPPTSLHDASWETLRIRIPTCTPAGYSLRALDLFCGAGGATKGLQRAGFHVTGVDIKPQRSYVGDAFLRMDAPTIEPNFIAGFDFVWASPPCQAHTSLKTMHNAKKHVDLIPQTRALLRASGKPYVIENVVGAPLQNPFMLCGTQFGLGIEGAQLRRHRLFETNFGLAFPRRCKHKGRAIGVYGGGHGVSLHRHAKGERCHTAAQQRVAMGIDWMTVDELSQAIPPAYSEFIARAFLAQQKNNTLPRWVLASSEQHQGTTDEGRYNGLPDGRSSSPLHTRTDDP